MYQGIRTLFRRRRRALPGSRDEFLNLVSGVVHVGANVGQERSLYLAHRLRVVWIEPIPEVFAMLRANIRLLRSQRAIQALVTDVDDKEYEFHVANNRGASSSILRFKHHADIWPEVRFETSVRIRSVTLDTLFRREGLQVEDYQALIMDTQGSELLVLEGCIPILRNFRFIKIEVFDFEAYEGCCQLADIERFMSRHGYQERIREQFASRDEGGSCFDVVYERIGSP